MVQGYSGHAKYNGGLDVARKILQSEGVRGLYRGFGLSIMTYTPSSAVWWASYGSSQRIIWRLVAGPFLFFSFQFKEECDTDALSYRIRIYN